MKKLVILGASGSIGQSTMDIIYDHQDLFSIRGISVNNNIAILEDFLKKFKIDNVCVGSGSDYLLLKNKYPQINFFYGSEGLITLCTLNDVDMVVNALVGFVGLKPTLIAIENGHDIALANKETLVVAGDLIKVACLKHKVQLLPIDSEHSAIFQCISNQKVAVKKLLITASGGSFRDKKRDELADVTKEMALNHPNWSMGAKITIDSATMMNKGFEIIEAHYLFDVDYENIEVLFHRQSIVHSLVEFNDHSILAQLGTADMRIPIQYALSYPTRIEMLQDNTLDLIKSNTLSFEAMDLIRYPLLALAYKVGKQGGILPCVMNAANEIAVERFLKDEIKFLDIESIIFKCVKHFENEFVSVENINQLIEVDALARKYAKEL